MKILSIKRLRVLIALVFLLSACSPASSNSNPFAPGPTATPRRISNSPTPSASWLNVDLQDVNTGKHFTIASYKGKVVVIDGMATWCSTCFRESLELKQLNKAYGPQSDLVTVSLEWDLKEDAAVVKSYTSQFGFNWPFAITPMVIFHDVGNTYGALYLDPTYTPILFIDKGGRIHALNLGFKSAADLERLIDPYLKAGAS